ncbi:hypothetical protein [Flavobacterium lindanitolerans]|uniref:Uncharacterized protein n=1 Tax=Flavobacterium lindanitolerans TaxID=428988 RepID=A0A497UXZ8_9FLAO|nr:hypothetical protein [Flavobacterium lindanitolerans]PKW28595.1 hypothetical protein B0G92_0218 [Flavobacterium lindanitolerans]RLJ35900.1 hypothetical protein CLV50_1286 [Flavobacterium lindanitolerans]
MQKFLLLLAFLILNFFQLFAQEKGTNNHIKAEGTHFTEPVKDKKWANENGNTYTKARYSEYEGETFVKITASKDANTLLKYDIKVKKGTLEMRVVNGQNEVLFQKSFSKDEKGETEVLFQENQEYKIKFLGQQTAGSYFCQWIEK